MNLSTKYLQQLFFGVLCVHYSIVSFSQDSLHQIRKGNYIAIRVQYPDNLKLNQLNNGGIQLAGFQNFTRSKSLFNAALAISPQNDTLFYNSSLVAGKLKNYDEALSLMKKTGLGRRYLNNKGVWEAKLGQLEKGLADWENAPLFDTLFFNKSLANYRLGKYDEAIDNSKRIAFSKNPLFHELYAVNLFNQKKYKEAEKFFKKSMNVEASPRLLVQLANAHLAQKEYEKAQVLFEEYLETDNAKYRFAARLGLGHVLYFLRKYREAVLEYDAACILNAKSVEAWVGLGNAHLGCGGQRQAQKAYERALHLDALRKDAWLGLAMVNYRLGNYNQAICCFDEAKGFMDSKNKHHADLYAARGFCKLYSNKVKEAKPDIDSAVRLDRNILTLTALSEYLRMEGYFLSSLKWLDKAFKAHGEGHDRLLVNRGNIYLKTQNYEDAFDDFWEANRLNPRNINAQNGLAISYLNMDEMDMARVIYDSLLRKHNVPMLLNNRGITRSYIALRELQEKDEANATKFHLLALQDFHKGIEIDSSKTAYNVNIGNVHKNRREESPAIEHYQKYLSKTAINNLGVLFSKGSRKDFALHYINTAIDLDTANPVFLYNRAKLYQDFFKADFKSRRDLQKDIKVLPTNDISMKYSPDGFVSVFLFDYNFDTFNFPGEPIIEVLPQAIDDFDFLPSLDFIAMPQKNKQLYRSEVVQQSFKNKSNKYSPKSRRGQGSTSCPKII